MMTCTVCKSPKRGKIEAAITQGESLRSVAKRFETSASAVNRHKTKCMGKALELVKDDREKTSGLDILKELENVNREAKSVLSQARKEKDGRLVLLALDRICKQLEVQARFLEILRNQEQKEGTGLLPVRYIMIHTPYERDDPEQVERLAGIDAEIEEYLNGRPTRFTLKLED